MEVSFQQDKKNLLVRELCLKYQHRLLFIAVLLCQAHQEMLTQQFSTLQEESHVHMTQLEENIEQLKNRLAEETKGRMEEEEKFSDMLKELQELVNLERSAKESISQEVHVACSCGIFLIMSCIFVFSCRLPLLNCTPANDK